MKKLLAMILALCMLFALGAVSAFAEEEAAEEEEENYDTGDASLDDPRNQDGIGEKEQLVISFG